MNSKKIILVVDDISCNIDVLRTILKQDYIVKAATSGKKALQISNLDPQPSLILLDVMMPEMDGYEVCEKLKSNASTSHIPVIFVTGMVESEDEARGFMAGAIDYITKPVTPMVVLARVKTHLDLADQKHMLERMVQERTRELELTKQATIMSLASLAECRDNETGGHIMRTQHYVRILAERMAPLEGFKEFLNDTTINLCFSCAPLHDIGKVGVPDSILLKPGKLTFEEFEIMKKHTIYGYEALTKAESILAGKVHSNFLDLAREIAYTHHEKWDGSGYPNNLVAEDIPIAGRILAVADVYDALISKRVYKAPMPHEKAVQIILEGKGNHFDPRIVDVFLECEEAIRFCALKYADYEEEINNLKPH